METPWSSIGYITYKRTYSRSVDDVSTKTEEFSDTVDRVIKACSTQLKCGFTPEEENTLRNYMLGLKGIVAGRFLWQLGTKTVERLGLASLQNCAATVVDEPVRPFTWTMDMLMLGSGVGYNIQKKYVDKIPPVKDNFKTPTRVNDAGADFIVPDSREGWVALLGKVLKSAFLAHESGKQTFTYSTQLVRGKGVPIKGFGGVTSGPEDLVWGINEIGKILEKRAGRKIRPIDALDIMNIIGSVVVSGNVRRCLPEGSLVHTKRGLIPIQDVVPGEDEALTRHGYRKITNRFKQGKQRCLKVTTKDGYFVCTPNHKMATAVSALEHTWVQAKDLTKDHNLLSARHSIEGITTNLPTWSYDYPERSTTCKELTVPTLDEDMAWFIGLFQADGYTFANLKDGGFNAYVSLVFADYELDIANKAKQQLQRFGKDFNITLKKRKDENAYIVHCQSKQLATYFHNFIKQPKTPLQVPSFILQARESIKLAYMAGVLDGDGSSEGRPTQIVSSVYLDWTKQLQTLLYSCGIESRLTVGTECKSREGWQPLHKLYIISNYSKNKIKETPQLLKNIPEREHSQNTCGVPSSWINDASLKQEFGLRQAKRMNSDSYESRVSKLDALPVPVISVEDFGEFETYDIEVADLHEFYCEGYLTHNSAQIAIGDPDDVEFLLAKRWDMGTIPSWRAMSNNSVACDNINDLHEFFWDGYKGKGEPYGLINFRLTKKVGRLGETEYPDPDAVCYNPCFAPETLITTDKGLFPIEDLVGKTVNVWSNDKWVTINNFRVTGKNKKILKITLQDGSDIRVTPNHTMILDNGNRVLASDLQIGDRLKLSDVEVHGNVHSNGAYIKGFLCGDGTINRERPLLYLYPPKYVCQDRLISSANEIANGEVLTNAIEDLCFVDQESKGKQRKIMRGLAPKKSELTPWAAVNKLRLPTEVYTWDKESKCQFIAGLMDADGTASDTVNGFMYQVVSVHKQFLLDFQTLLKTIGVQSKISLMHSAGTTDFNDGYGEYKTQDSYRLTISQAASIKLSEQVSFSRLVSFKDKKTTYNLKSKRGVVVDIQEDGTEELVYCCTVPETHSLAIGVGVTIGQCSEQPLNQYETCCLAEIYLPNISSQEELTNLSKLLYRVCKHSLMLPCHNKETESIVHANMRMGLGITGYLESTKEQKSWLSPTYEALRAYDKKYSKELGVNTSIKLCTVKPSGTLSLLPGVTPGVHPAYAKFMIRRIRMASNHALVKVCRDHGYKVEYARNFDGSNDHTTVVVEFPFRHKDTAVLAKDITAIKQLEYVKELQTVWSDNAVSCTVYYKPDELEGIQEYLKKNYKNTIKAVSFLLHSEHGFDQAPLEEISEEQYKELLATTKPITSIEEAQIGLGEECAGGACPIR